jgi:hypothetical protein
MMIIGCDYHPGVSANCVLWIRILENCARDGWRVGRKRKGFTAISGRKE